MRLNGCVAVDAKGYVLTGLPDADGTPARFAFETSMPRVFAIGDARAGSTKRVAAAVGEGAQVVAALHSYLAASGGAKAPTLAVLVQKS